MKNAVVLGLSLALWSACGDSTVSPDAASRPDLAVSPTTDFAGTAPPDFAGRATPTIKTVFLVMLSNHNWSDIKGSASAPYINSTLLPMGAHAENYFNPTGIHPSEPDYLWLEAGTNFGITTDMLPSVNSQTSTAHLATLLKNANIPWKAYLEDITADTCPLTNVKSYAPKENPFVFFTDSTGNGNPLDPYCVAHNRPLSELAADLKAGKVSGYNFIKGNLCHDMHDACAPTNNQIQQGDDFLKQTIPLILASTAFQQGGALFIGWDESELGELPIGMIAIASNAKPGYSNSIKYTHSATLRTMQEIFGVAPFLGDAAASNDLSDLFLQFP